MVSRELGDGRRMDRLDRRWGGIALQNGEAKVAGGRGGRCKLRNAATSIGRETHGERLRVRRTGEQVRLHHMFISEWLDRILKRLDTHLHHDGRDYVRLGHL